MKMKNLLLAALLLFAAYEYFNNQHSSTVNEAQLSTSLHHSDNSDAAIARAFSNHVSNLQVSGQGVVIKVLPDDNSGSRHQKLIIKLASGQTLLIAHNVDIAPRLSSIHEGDTIQFNGEYEWSEKGGVLHWTHRDPKGSHTAGWLKHQGQTYQ